MTHLLLAMIYLAFISLGLPDSLLGSAWPAMYQGFGVPISYAGVVSMIIAIGTAVSSLQSDRLTKKLGTGRVTALSVLTTAIALFGFSISHSFALVCLWAIPYGLGAGSVDASLNNYVALHYTSRHMSWLHCMWGLGASFGPYVMGYVLSGGQSWNMGYRYIAILQIALTAILLLALPLWKKSPGDDSAVSRADAQSKPLSLGQIFKLPGAKPAMITFICYSGVEQTTGLWASSYLVLHVGLSSEAAARFASLVFIGITIGRVLSGFLTMKFDDTKMVRLGQIMIAIGVMSLLLPLGAISAYLGLILVGLGCAPIYPCIIHSVPAHFGADMSQAVIGVLMASASVGTLLMPPLFGVLAEYIDVGLLPLYLLLMLGVMTVMYGMLLLKSKKRATSKGALSEV